MTKTTERVGFALLLTLALGTVAVAIYAGTVISNQEQELAAQTRHIHSLESQQRDLEVVITNDQARLTESGK